MVVRTNRTASVRMNRPALRIAFIFLVVCTFAVITSIFPIDVVHHDFAAEKPAGITGGNDNHKLPLRAQSLDIPSISAHPSTNSSIPRILIFTYNSNLINSRYPGHLHANVKNTIQVYAEAWGITNRTRMDLRFYTDNDCRGLLEQEEPKLLPFFNAENFGAYKGDLCRVAALYQHGGYYLDVDIQTLKALDPPADVDFITAKMPNANAFFQAVMAFPPRHPILKGALESMLIDWYMIPSVMREYKKTESDLNFFKSKEYEEAKRKYLKSFVEDPAQILLGPVTLYLAFDRQRNTTNPWILEEIDNGDRKLYPELMREATRWGCNYVVHDPADKTPYFYSRCRGTWLCP